MRLGQITGISFLVLLLIVFMEDTAISQVQTDNRTPEERADDRRYQRSRDTRADELAEEERREQDRRYRDNLTRQTEQENRRLRERATQRCQDERARVSEAEADLPSGCLSNGDCLRAREKCNHFINGISGTAAMRAFTSTPPESLLDGFAQNCPELAREKYDDSSDELEEMTDKEEDLAVDLRDLGEDMSDSVEDRQKDRLELDEEIQEITAKMQESSLDLNQMVSSPPKEIQDVLGQSQGTIEQITNQIAELSRQIQTRSSEGSNAAYRVYRQAVRDVFNGCQQEAENKARERNASFEQQSQQGGVVVRNIFDLKENRSSKVQREALRVYSLCQIRNSTKTALSDAREDYEGRVRQLEREQQADIAQINVLRHQLSTIESHLDRTIQQTDRAFDAAFERHVHEMNTLAQQLQLKNQQKQQLEQRGRTEEAQLHSQYQVKTRELQNARMRKLALEHEVKNLKPSSYFGGNASRARDEISYTEYQSTLSTARASCCGEALAGGFIHIASNALDSLCTSSALSAGRRAYRSRNTASGGDL